MSAASQLPIKQRTNEYRACYHQNEHQPTETAFFIFGYRRTHTQQHVPLLCEVASPSAQQAQDTQPPSHIPLRRTGPIRTPRGHTHVPAATALHRARRRLGRLSARAAQHTRNVAAAYPRAESKCVDKQPHAIDRSRPRRCGERRRVSVRRSGSAQRRIPGDRRRAASRGAPDAECECAAPTHTGERATCDTARRVLCVGRGQGEAHCECACENSHSQEEFGIADAYVEGMGGCDAWYDIIRVETGGVTRASGIVERVDEEMADVDTNKVKQI